MTRGRSVLGRRYGASVLAWVIASVCLGFVLTSVRSVAAQPSAAELDPNLGWLNTDKPLRFSDELKGHVVVLDFWTYCCINCMHILPDLEALEEKYKNDPVVIIGVHSAKFANEGSPESIRQAIFRYGIRHPVVIDTGFSIWNRYDIHGWPSFVVIGTDGKLVDLARAGTGRPMYARSGEGNRAVLDDAIAKALEQGRSDGTLAAKRVDIRADASVPSASGLAFPGKVLACASGDGTPGWMFVADSSHNRIVVAKFDRDDASRCSLVKVFGGHAAGSQQPGMRDGVADEATFNDPQGMAYDARKQVLFVADTKHHAIRVIHLAGDGQMRVTTLVGNGKQSNDRIGGGAGREQGLNSPWDLALTPDGKTLYVAMAGTHQLWSVETETGVASAIAGGNREDILDGEAKRACLAQPSGLALATEVGNDGEARKPTRLYFADAEVSAIRYLDFTDNTINTVIGTGLFDFGDVDGTYPEARLQHCLGLTIVPKREAKGTLDYALLVADTYNHKIKRVDPPTLSAESWIGLGRGGSPTDASLMLDEPGGVCYLAGSDGASDRVYVADTNNHRIVMVDPSDRSWKEVMIDGLAVPVKDGTEADKPERVVRAAVKAKPGTDLRLLLTVKMPEGGKLNAEMPIGVRVSRTQSPGGSGSSSVNASRLVSQRTVRSAKWPVEIDVPGNEIVPGAMFRIDVSFGWCEEGSAGVCVPGGAHWQVTIEQGDASTAELHGGE